MFKSKNMLIGLMSAAVLAAVGSAQASTNLLLNPSFSGTPSGYTVLTFAGNSPGSFASQGANANIADWGGDASNFTNYYWSVGAQTVSNGNLLATDGNGNPVTGDVGYANSTGDYLFQDVGSLRANTTYNLNVGVGSDTTGAVSTVMLYNGSITSLTPLTTASAGVLASGSYIGPSPTVNYETISYTTGATVSGDLTVILGEDLQSTPTTAPATFLQSDFFNPTLTATTVSTPEPASLALFGVAAAGLLLLNRRKLAGQA